MSRDKGNMSRCHSIETTRTALQKRAGQGPFAIALGLAAVILGLGCGEIRTNRQLEQSVNTTLNTGVGGTLFRLKKIGDLPNPFGGRDIWGGTVDRGFAEMRLAGIDGSTLLLDVTDVSRQSTERVMDHPFRQNPRVNMESEPSQRQFRISLDTAKQHDVVTSGVRVTFVDVQPYSIRYTVEDLPH